MPGYAEHLEIGLLLWQTALQWCPRADSIYPQHVQSWFSLAPYVIANLNDNVEHFNVILQVLECYAVLLPHDSLLQLPGLLDALCNVLDRRLLETAVGPTCDTVDILLQITPLHALPGWDCVLQHSLRTFCFESPADPDEAAIGGLMGIMGRCLWMDPVHTMQVVRGCSPEPDVASRKFLSVLLRTAQVTRRTYQAKVMTMAFGKLLGMGFEVAYEYLPLFTEIALEVAGLLLDFALDRSIPIEEATSLVE